MSLKRLFSLYFLISFFVLSYYSHSLAQEILERDGKCILKIHLPKNREEMAHINYIMNFFSYKTESVSDAVIILGDGEYKEFNMDKSCQEILQRIVKKL